MNVGRQGARERDAGLMDLFRVIAARDVAGASAVLAVSPALAAQRVEAGSSREDPETYYFASISRHVYAGDTALHLAAAAHAAEIARELVSRGAPAGARNRRGAEPLHYAADGFPGAASWDPDAQAAVVSFLIRVGADPNAADDSGVTPLHRAVRTRSASAVRALLDNGAEARRVNKSGSTPLHLAVQNTGRGGTGSAAARREQAEIIRLLIVRGASPLDQDSAGVSVLDRARAGWIRELLVPG